MIEVKYKCMDDCAMNGCPTHSIKIKEETTSGIYVVTDTRTEDFEQPLILDGNGMDALFAAISKVRCDILVDKLKRHKGNGRPTIEYVNPKTGEVVATINSTTK